MLFFILTFISAFEFSLSAGDVSGMGAGVAVEKWQQSLGLNPALAANKLRLAGAIVYAQPYGLKGLNCAWAGVKFKFGNFHSVSGLEILSLSGNNEIDIATALAAPIAMSLSGGLAIHGLVQHFRGLSPDIVPGVDLGFVWAINRFSAAIALRQINSPRFRNGDELFPIFRAGLAWQPAEPVLLALDIEKEAEVERLLFGIEFRLFNELTVRSGVTTFPLCLRAGLGLRLGFLGFDYGFEHNPDMGDTHIWGVNCQRN